MPGAERRKKRAHHLPLEGTLQLIGLGRHQQQLLWRDLQVLLTAALHPGIRAG
jgi:hypothetical protein